MLRRTAAGLSVLILLVLAGPGGFAQDAALKDEFRSRLEDLAADDLDGHVALLSWCEENALEEQVATVSEKILKIDPENREARRALGHRRVPPGRWLTLDEYHGDVVFTAVLVGFAHERLGGPLDVAAGTFDDVQDAIIADHAVETIGAKHVNVARLDVLEAHVDRDRILHSESACDHVARKTLFLGVGQIGHDQQVIVQ